MLQRKRKTLYWVLIPALFFAKISTADLGGAALGKLLVFPAIVVALAGLLL